MLVLAFKQKPTNENPLYYGKMFIDVKSLAVISATFQQNVEDKIKSGLLLTRKNLLVLMFILQKSAIKLTTDNKMVNGFLPILVGI